MKFTRGSGILLHPTSLPGLNGSGEIGTQAKEFIRWLARAGQRYWQILPLGPAGYGNSPYSSVSAFASNPLLIELDDLVSRGWIPAAALSDVPRASVNDSAPTTAFRWRVLSEASERFFAEPAGRRQSFTEFCSQQHAWLDDYALFMALNQRFGGGEWTSWPASLARRQPEALATAREELQSAVRLHQFTQWIFSEQWSALRREGTAAGVKIIGDIPIFVAFHSADVWANPEIFHLDASGRPTVVAGVPPDYFSATGQRWGNPLYRWDVLATRGFDWWLRRFKAVFEQVDIARIDHFRGFAGYWEIPASEPTAQKGRWVPGPGTAFFDAVRNSLGELPIVAEDLGVITPDVTALRDRFDLPGMKVLQFAFGSGPANPFLPHNHSGRSVVYTGTHDNDTTRGWFATAPPREREYAQRYMRTDGSEVHWDLIRLGAGSVAEIAVVPMQDILGLGSEGRMNTPGRASGNWAWRFDWKDVQPEMTARLRDVTETYGRCDVSS
jgi:4-alpha-glucanotransferase